MNEVYKLGTKLLKLLEKIGLIIIAIATVIATGIEIKTMIEANTVTLADLLLLFIYLEVLTMVAMYLESGKLPVRMPLYIAIVALARYMVLDMKSLDNWRIIEISAAILLIAIAVVVHRYGHLKLPYPNKKDGLS